MQQIFKITIFLSIILFACKKDKYFNIPEKMRNVAMYYSHEKGDSVKYILNNSDTFILRIRNKNIGYNNNAGPYRHSFHEFFNLECFQLNHSLIDDINLRSDIQFDYESNKFICSTGFKNLSIHFFCEEDIKYIGELTIDNITFHNVYLLSNNSDSIYSSPNKGIIKAWNDSLTFILIE
jgi:hypothetical protein